MRADQFISEVLMRPSAIKRDATALRPKIGIEFELIAPGFIAPEVEQEPDYTADRAVSTIENLVDFYDVRDANDESSIRSLHARLNNDYGGWLEERAYNSWKENYETFIKQDLQSKYPEYSEDEIQQRFDEIDNDGESDEYYRALREEYTEEYIDDIRERSRIQQEFLADQGIRWMSEVRDVYSVVSWPYMQSQSSDNDDVEERAMQDIRQSLKPYLPQGVDYTTSHRGGTVKQHFMVMPDSSIDAKSGEIGAEIVSPPMSLDAMRDTIDRIKSWAAQYGARTDSSCGLHMNISTSNFNRSTLDYLKLVLLLGDDYILKQFDRLANEYAESSLRKISADIERQTPTTIAKYFDEMRSGLDRAASETMAYMRTDEHVSVSVRGIGQDWVEFRGPGNDWLSQSTDTLMNTAYRMVVALDASMDPQKYRQEYLKKLYKLLVSTHPAEEDIIQLFVLYSVKRRGPYSLGPTDAERVKFNFVERVRELQQSRRAKRAVRSGSHPLYNWIVHRSGFTSISPVVTAATSHDAMKMAVYTVSGWSDLARYVQSNMYDQLERVLTATPLGISKEKPTGQRYAIFSKDDPSKNITYFYGSQNNTSTRRRFEQRLHDMGVVNTSDFGFRQVFDNNNVRT